MRGHARVAGQEAVLAENVLVVLVILLQGAGNAQFHGARLTGLSAAIHVGMHVELARGLGDLERCHDLKLILKDGEKLVEGLAIDRDVARSVANTDAGHSGLSSACSPVVFFFCQVALSFWRLRSFAL